MWICGLVNYFNHINVCISLKKSSTELETRSMNQLLEIQIVVKILQNFIILIVDLDVVLNIKNNCNFYSLFIYIIKNYQKS